MKRAVGSLLLMWLLALPIHVWADAEVHEWIGEWDMNHDGWLGTLSIMDSKQDCATSRWCHLVVKYTDKDGNRRTGRIARIDQRFQHMVFYVNFPDNAQKFDAYVFSWDKAKMAGTTIWGGRTFGFFATKK